MDSVNQYITVGGLRIPSQNIAEWRKLRAHAQLLRLKGKDVPPAIAVKIHQLAGAKPEQARLLIQAHRTRKFHDRTKVTEKDIRTFGGSDKRLIEFRAVVREITDGLKRVGLSNEGSENAIRLAYGSKGKRHDLRSGDRKKK